MISRVLSRVAGLARASPSAGSAALAAEAGSRLGSTRAWAPFAAQEPADDSDHEHSTVQAGVLSGLATARDGQRFVAQFRGVPYGDEFEAMLMQALLVDTRLMRTGNFSKQELWNAVIGRLAGHVTDTLHARARVPVKGQGPREIRRSRAEWARQPMQGSGERATVLLPRVVGLSHLCLDAMRDTGVVARPAHWARLLRASAELVMASLPDGFAPDAKSVDLCVEGLGSLLARFDADVDAGLAEPSRASDLAPPVLAFSLRGDARAQAVFVLAVKLEAMAGASGARSRSGRSHGRDQPMVRAWLPERLWGCLIKGMAVRGDVAGVRSALQRMRAGHSTSLWALAGRSRPPPATTHGAGDFRSEWSDDENDDAEDDEAGQRGARTPRARAGTDAPVAASPPRDFSVQVMPVEPTGQTLRMLVRAHAVAKDWGGARAAIDEALDALAAAPAPRSAARQQGADAVAVQSASARDTGGGDDAAGLWGELMDAAVRAGETALARSLFEEASGADSRVPREVPGWLWQLRVRAASSPADAEATLATMMRPAAGADAPRAWPGIWATLFDLHESQRCAEGMASVVGRMRGGVVCWRGSRAAATEQAAPAAGELVWATHNNITAPVGQVEVLTNSVVPSVAFARRAGNATKRSGKRPGKGASARRRG